MAMSTNILYALHAINGLPYPAPQVSSMPNRIRVIFESVAMMEIVSCAKEALGVMLRDSGLSKMRISFSDTTTSVFGSELDNISDDEKVFLACFGTEQLPKDGIADTKELQRLTHQARCSKALWQLVETELEPLWEEQEKLTSHEAERRVLSGESFQDVMEQMLRERVGEQSFVEIYESFITKYAEFSPALAAMVDGIPIEDIIA